MGRSIFLNRLPSKSSLATIPFSLTLSSYLIENVVGRSSGKPYTVPDPVGGRGEHAPLFLAE